ncbi:uncharacterized protein AB675_3033 [Cyphellophora attinorum]|uniref:Uncharacterized protein n=1 Tax=Cyphellophora attinorum TaxID=1664694 RepID=A0A0N1HLM7_9EURO|nr:uncharacterized protein AB675_3033 [Phialophora attinorum]KPI37972.1 hypothetical protein AB675_3033 [Phialophora attinorum]
MPATHGDPSLPYHELPAANFMPHIIPSKSIAMRAEDIRPLQFKPEWTIPMNISTTKSIVPDIDDLGQISYMDPEGEQVEDTYYGWSRAFCENMKARRRGSTHNARRTRSRSYSSGSSRSRSRSPHKRRRLSSASEASSPGPAPGLGASSNHKNKFRPPPRSRSTSPPPAMGPSLGSQNTTNVPPPPNFPPSGLPTVPPMPFLLGPNGVPMPPPRPPNWNGPWPPPLPPPPPPPGHQGMWNSR